MYRIMSARWSEVSLDIYRIYKEFKSANQMNPNFI